MTNTVNSFETLIQRCDAEIRAGHPQYVSRHLSSLNAARAPKEFRLPLANICRRAGLFTLGLRLLSRTVMSRSS